MHIVIVGGGKLGYYLARNLLDRDYTVNLIEKNRIHCKKIATDLDAEVFYGDGTTLETLARAGIERADCFIAVTGQDQDNLVACQLAKKRFSVPKVIARANNPRNMQALRQLGADIVMSSTEIITRMIEQEVENAGMRLLANLNRGKAGIGSFTLPAHSHLDGMALKNVPMPPSSLIVSLVRGEKLIIPQGDTVIHAGDEIIAVCENSQQTALNKLFGEH